MYERDLELGPLPSRPVRGTFDFDLSTSQSSASSDTLWTNSYERADQGRDGLSAIAERGGGGTPEEPSAVDDEEQYVKLPRRKVEQLMGMWIDVLQQSLKAEEGQRLGFTQSSQPKAKKHRRLSSYAYGQYPPVLRSRDEQPWATIERMSGADIEAENEYRRLRRQEWRPYDHMTDLEDSWRTLWEPLPGVDKGLFQWPGSSEETRKSVQLELADALTGNDRIVAVNMHMQQYMQRDFRAISTWISLIGLRLNDQYRSYNRPPELGPLTQVKVLIECIWACNAFDPNINPKQGYREGPRLSNVLSACYRRGVLDRPEPGFDDRVTMIYLKRHCQSVRRALHLMNLLQRHYISPYVPVDDLRDAQEVWDMPLPDVEAPTPAISTLAPSATEPREGSEMFLRIDDFNLRDLQTLGRLQIHWTSYWDEHLSLETSSTANILKIFWFQPRLCRYLVENHLCTHMTSSELTRREDEIYRTWCLIFTSKSTPRTSFSRYTTLKAPRWLSLLAHARLSTWTAEQATNSSPDKYPPLSLFTRPSSFPVPSFFPSSAPTTSSLKSFDLFTSDHLLLRWSPNSKLPHSRISYSQFPVYGARLRELRTYMDSQQPTGLRALWKDRRNSNGYYTFWFVTIFGTLSVFLATCALAVSIAQTWAAFRQAGP